MTEKPRNPTKSDAKTNRRDRLGGELRANLQRRKSQIRARRVGEADHRAEGLQPEKPEPDR